MEKWRAKPRRCLDQDLPSPCSAPHFLRLTETRSPALPPRLRGGSLPLLHLEGGWTSPSLAAYLPPFPCPLWGHTTPQSCEASGVASVPYMAPWGRVMGLHLPRDTPKHTHRPLEAPFLASSSLPCPPELCRGGGRVLGLSDCPSADTLSPSSTLPSHVPPWVGPLSLPPGGLLTCLRLRE